MVTQVTTQEKDSISMVFAEGMLSMCLLDYRECRAQMLEIKAISFPYGSELMRAISARKEWSLARKRVNELEKEVA